MTRDTAVLSEVRSNGFHRPNVFNSTLMQKADEVVLFTGIRYLVHHLPSLQTNDALVSALMAGMAIGQQSEWMAHEPTI